MLLWKTLFFYAAVRIKQDNIENNEPVFLQLLHIDGETLSSLSKSTALWAFHRAGTTFRGLGRLDSTGVLGHFRLGCILDGLDPFVALDRFPRRPTATFAGR